MDAKNIAKRYTRELLVGMLIYITLLVGSLTIINRFELPNLLWLSILISLSPAIGVIFVMRALARLLRDSDEFLQLVQLRATAFAAGMTALITFSYGFLENIGLPKFPTFGVLPLMIFLWGIGLAYISRRYE